MCVINNETHLTYKFTKSIQTFLLLKGRIRSKIRIRQNDPPWIRIRDSATDTKLRWLSVALTCQESGWVQVPRADSPVRQTARRTTAGRGAVPNSKSVLYIKCIKNVMFTNLQYFMTNIPQMMRQGYSYGSALK